MLNLFAFSVLVPMIKVDIPAEKQKVLQTLNQLFDVVYFYDDDQHNVDLAGQVGVKTYLV